MHNDRAFLLSKQFGYPLPENALDLLCKFEKSIVKANKTLNLLSPGELSCLWSRHFIDSIVPLFLDVIHSHGKLIDIGSGAGLPGIPLAIAAPTLEISMVESNKKKARFAERVIRELNLKNAHIIQDRAEQYKTGVFFNFACARAFASIHKTLPILSGFIARGGKIILYKGPNCDAEILDAEETRIKLGLSKPTIVSIPPELSPEKFKIVEYIKD